MEDRREDDEIILQIAFTIQRLLLFKASQMKILELNNVN